jgi:A/G-specific adenine glycosylase
MDEKERLLAWYRDGRRDLPWRRDADPYRVWVSEIMLQQTRAETVIPYFEAFLERFPVVEDLAAADLEEVLSAWSGLGYYQRARRMHQAAREIVSRGGFPSDADQLQSLPGIGRYTAAAIASIAFAVPVVALDGNVERVLSRLQAFEGDPRSQAGRKVLTTAGQEWVSCDDPGDMNQALMELGATVCTPSRPRCGVCPLEEICRARRLGVPERFPKRRKVREAVPELRLAVLVESDGRLLLFRRPEDAELLAGIWEVPWISASTAGEAEARLEKQYGGKWSLAASLARVRHTITFRKITTEVWKGDRAQDQDVAEGPEAGWFTPEEIEELPTSSLVVKILGCRAPDQVSEE